ncbi:MAG TPA: condensation domain-containing protein, partial [Ktedonobacteraceae bacterium]
MSNVPKPKAPFSSERRKLLDLLLQEERIDLARQQTISRSDARGFLPLSFAQERLWFLDQLNPGDIAYNMPVTMHLSGSLDVSALEQSLNELIHRHEALRTTFPTVEGYPVQVIAQNQAVLLPTVDLQALPEGKAREMEWRRLANEEAQRPFDLKRGPLLRAMLLHLCEEEHILLLTMHHIVSDGWSLDICRQELATLYAACSSGQSSPLPELPIQYTDFALWQRQWLQGQILEQQLAYWRQQLAGAPALELPTNRLHTAAQTRRAATQCLLLPKMLSMELKALSQQSGMSLYMLLLAVFQTLLYRYTSQEDIVVGTPVAGRNHRETEGLIGFFVNMLVMRTSLSGNPTFRELLGRVREVTLDAYAHQELP